MAGGTGGRANNPTSNNVKGGTGGSQLLGTTATAGGLGGGGGGGGAGGGGPGGAGGQDAAIVGGNGGAGGADGTGTAETLGAGTDSTGGAGVQGGDGIGGGGGGGGGEGGYGAVLTAGQNVTNAASVLGGTGGIGGNGIPGGYGGSGGNGGVGLLFAATSPAAMVRNTGSIAGGVGGAAGTPPGGGYGGAAGSGGIGASFQTAAALDNSGSIRGGNEGPVTSSGVAYGAGPGVGIAGSGLHVTAEANSSIAGGTGADGQADAIDFLSGANTLTLDGGTLTGGILDGATDPATSLTFDQTTAQSLSNTIKGVGSVIDTGSGTLTLAGAGDSYSGATLVEQGTLRGGAANAFGTNSAATVDASTLDLGGFAQAIGSLSGDSGGIVTDSDAVATLTLGGGNGSGTFGGTIRDGAGAVALDKVGTGTETLAGTDGYTGGTTIAAGTLVFASVAAVPPGTITFAGNRATLGLDAAPVNGATFADPLGNLLPGDALDLQSLAFTPGASATVSGNVLTVTSGATTERFILTDAIANTGRVAQDAAGGTLVTATELSGTGGRAENPGSTDVAGGQPGSQLDGTVATAGGPGGGGGGGGAGGSGAGGAGGGTNGVVGGNGGAGGADGTGTAATLGAGTASTGGAGVEGGAGMNGGGGGGGGEGGYGAVLAGGQNVTNAASVLGGAGGAGGVGLPGAYGSADAGLGGGGGGGGGDGGVGLLVASPGAAVLLRNTGSIAGGVGGAGSSAGAAGYGTVGGTGDAGAGGNGAVGLLLRTGAVLDNSGSITGGDGGAAGSNPSGQDSPAGLGGAGIVVSGLQVTAESNSSIGGGTGAAGQADAIDFLSGANTLTLDGGMVTGAILDGATDPATSLTFDQTTAQTLSNTITGAGRVIDTGSGILTLTGTANSYSGGTTLSGGLLNVKYGNGTPAATTLGTGPIAFEGGTLGLDDVTLGNSATLGAMGGGIFLDTDTFFGGETENAVGEIDGDIGTAPGTNAGVFTVSAAVASNSFRGGEDTGLTLTGNDTFAGGLAIINASVTVGNGGTTGTLTGNVTGKSTGSGYGSLSFKHAPGTTTTFAGNLSGDIGLDDGGGITLLTGINTYTRATLFGTFVASDTDTENASILRAGSAGAFSAASQLNIDSSDGDGVFTIDLAGFNETIGGLLASSTNDDPRQFDIVTNSGSAAATLTIAAGGPSTPYATQQNQLYGGYGRFFDGLIKDGDPSQGGGTLAVDVGGNLNLSLPSTYSGGTTVEAGGTLTFLTESAGRNTEGVRTAFGGVQGAITDNGTLSLIAVSSYGFTGPLVVANAISGSGGVTATVDPKNAGLDGIALLTGADTYTGATLVDHGTLQGGVANAFGTGSAVTVNGNTFGHGATLDLGGNAQAIGPLSGDSGGIVTDSGAGATLTLGAGDGSGTFLGTIRDGAGAVTLLKLGVGTETLAGTDSYTGGTTIAAGTLEFATDAALPPGTIAFAGNQATLRLDAAPANGATFADPVSGLLPGDAIDLRGLAFAPGAKATVSGTTLAVTSGGNTETFTLAGASAPMFAVTQDAAGGTLVTGAVPPSGSLSIAGAIANQPVSDAATIDPFARVTVTDTRAGQTETVTITQDTALNGVLTDPNAATDGGSVAGNVMTLSGTAAQVSADLEALVFTPTAHQAAPGRTVITGFTLGVTDTEGATASDAATSVVATAVETPPAIGGTQAGQATSDQQTLHPFAAATVTDPDFGASETATITLSNGGTGGTLAGAGLMTTGGGIYTLTAASPAGEQAALRALVFTPATGHAATGNTVTTQAMISVTDGTDTATDGATTIAVTQAATGTAMNDVHMVTLDGLHYDFQADGDFTLERSTVAGNPFDIQIRTAACAEDNQASLTMQAAAQVGQSVVAFTPGGHVTINGIAETAQDAAHPVLQLDGGTLTALGNGDYQLDWAGGEGLTVTDEGAYLNLHTTVAPLDGPGSVQGLLGSLTGQANDLALPDGTVLAQPVPDADLLGRFASAWSVGSGSMLDGGGPAISPTVLGLPATPSFVIPTAPGEVLTGSLGQASPGGVTIQASLAELSGAVIANFASRDTIDLTGVALTAAQLHYAPGGPGDNLTITNGPNVVFAAITGPSPSAGLQVTPDAHGGTLVRFG